MTNSNAWRRWDQDTPRRIFAEVQAMRRTKLAMRFERASASGPVPAGSEWPDSDRDGCMRVPRDCGACLRPTIGESESEHAVRAGRTAGRRDARSTDVRADQSYLTISVAVLERAAPQELSVTVTITAHQCSSTGNVTDTQDPDSQPL